MQREADPHIVDAMVARLGTDAASVIPILQAIQKEFRYLPEFALRRVCDITDIAPAAIHSVATFFPQFRTQPAGEHTISVCDGTACHLKGAPAVFDAIAGELGIRGSDDTDEAGKFTIQKVRCLGCCTLAPAVQIDSVTYGHVQPDSVRRILDDFLAHASEPARAVSETQRGLPGDETEIRVGLGSCCVAGGSEKVRVALDETLAAFRIDVRVKRVSCVGMCHQTPLLEVVKPGHAPWIYAKVRPEDVSSIVLFHFPPRNPMARARAVASRWLEQTYTGGLDTARGLDPSQGPVAAFLDGQRRIATEYCGEIDPLDLDEYRARDGFKALQKCLNAMTPDAILDEVERSGVRGRGGAGFPTARKWREVKGAQGIRKFVVCNGDEGDPGAFMDRMILESYPYRVIEGMIVASLVVGAHEGIFYIRAEYPLAVARMRAAIERCVEAGILGDRVLGSAHALRVEVREGAGAFVCGEESALIASLEGRRPTPRYRPPFPAHRGLLDAPTLVNNVETFALIPWIMRNGAEAFASIGTQTSKGTKVFSLAGKVERGGLIEVPMGVTIRHIVETIGGGVAAGRTLKAVQIGGPSGGCIPDRLADLPVDYDTLAEAGSMMGSGGFVVLDDTDCMVEMSRFFLSFTQLESCGKCTPCRVGTKQMLEILGRLCEGKGTQDDLAHLERLAGVIKQQSLCGLGRTAPNPVITGLAHFRDEFEAHVAGRCPAHKCKALITYAIDDTCIGCTKCAQRCPVGAIAMAPYEVHAIDAVKCVRCGTCYAVCPVNAVKVE